MPSIISPRGLERLSNDHSSESRAAAAEYVGAALVAGGLDDTDSRIAEAILELLSRDPDLKVRQAVCEQLLNCLSIPESIARNLARDVDSISVPFLRRAQTLTDADLVEAIRGGNTLKQASIARRNIISPAISHELVATVKKKVVKTVLANEGADIAEQSFLKVVDDFGTLGSVQSLLIDRTDLPQSIYPNLVPLVSGPIAERLLESHPVPSQLRDDLAGKLGRPALLTAPLDKSNANITAPMSLLKTLCIGEFRFFISLIASLAGVPEKNAMILMSDAGKKGFAGLYSRARLPAVFLPDFELALRIVLEARRDGWTAPDDATRRQLAERFHLVPGPHGGDSLAIILDLVEE